MTKETPAILARRLLAGLLIGTAFTTTAMLAAPGPAAAQEARVFAIPPQPVPQAVAAFARVTGWQVAYPSEMRTRRTRPVNGSMSADRALAQMMAGTGIAIRRTGSDSAALVLPLGSADPASAPRDAVRLNPILLNAETATGAVGGIIARRSSSATKTDTPIIETPQTVNVIGREQMEQQGVATVTDALRYTPGVISGTNGGQSGRFDSYFVRGSGGFSAAANNANTLDGLRWRIPGRSGVQFDPWTVERVEVVKGPSSTLFGSGSPGGIVNLVSKRPLFQPRREVYAALTSESGVEAGADFTGPLSDTLAYRVVGLARKGDTGVDFQKDERFVIAPSLTYAPTDATTITLQALYHRDPRSPDAQFVPAYGSVLPIPGFGTVGPDFWQGDPNYQEFSRTQTALGWQIDYDITADWSFHSGFRWGRMETTSKSLDFLSASGTTITRYALLAEHDTESTATDNHVTGRFALGQTQHTLLAGIDYQKLSKGWANGADYNGGAMYPIDMADPVYGIAVTDPVLSTRIRQPFEQTGVYLQDQVSHGNWRFLAGLRHDWLKTGQGRYSMDGVGAMTTSDDSATTWRVGAVYLMENGYAPFVSYSTSFEPQLGVTADGSALDPSEGRMLEAGLRYLAPDNGLSWAATLFAGVNNRFAVADSVNTAQCAVVTGSPFGCQTDRNKRELRGLELEARAQLADGLDVIGALTLQKARLTESSDASINPGIATGKRSVDKRLVAVPDSFASVWLNYRVPENQPLSGWSFGGGVRYIGSAYATNSNEWGATEAAYAGRKSKVASFTLVDAAVGYDFGARDAALRGLSGKLTVHNLLNRDYVAACNGYGSCSFGSERVARLSLNYAW